MDKTYIIHVALISPSFFTKDFLKGQNLIAFFNCLCEAYAVMSTIQVIVINGVNVHTEKVKVTNISSIFYYM